MVRAEANVDEARAQAAEAQARALLTVLRVRGVEVPEAERGRILAEKGTRSAWSGGSRRPSYAMSLADVLDEPK